MEFLRDVVYSRTGQRKYKTSLEHIVVSKGLFEKGWQSKCNKYPGLNPGMEKGH